MFFWMRPNGFNNNGRGYDFQTPRLSPLPSLSPLFMNVRGKNPSPPMDSLHCLIAIIRSDAQQIYKLFYLSHTESHITECAQI